MEVNATEHRHSIWPRLIRRRVPGALIPGPVLLFGVCRLRLSNQRTPRRHPDAIPTPTRRGLLGRQ